MIYNHYDKDFKYMMKLFFHRIAVWNSEWKGQWPVNEPFSVYFNLIAGCVGLPDLSLQLLSNPGERTELFISLWACIWIMFSNMMFKCSNKLHLHYMLVLWPLSVTVTIQRLRTSLLVSGAQCETLAIFSMS